jgi:hypothetical protein
MRWLVLIFGMEVPALMSFIDAMHRDASGFEGGEADRRGWRVWLVLAMLLSPVLIGYGIVLTYYWNVIKRGTVAL